MQTINIDEAKTHLWKIIERVAPDFDAVDELVTDLFLTSFTRRQGFGRVVSPLPVGCD